MKQLEIEFFFPLTEQIELDLDFTPSEEWIVNERKKNVYGFKIGDTNGVVTFNRDFGFGSISSIAPITSSFVIRPSVENVGKWEISDSMFVYRPTKPNAVIRFMAKHLLGFKWHDEI